MTCKYLSGDFATMTGWSMCSSLAD